MADLKDTLSAEEQQKAKALLGHVQKGTSEYIETTFINPIQKRIDEIQASQLSTAAKLAKIEAEQKAFDDFTAKQLTTQEATYKSLFVEAKSWRHRKGIDQPTGGQVVMAYLNSVLNAGDGNQAAARLKAFETQQGFEYPELKNVFLAMGNQKAIVTIGNPQEGGFSVPIPLMQEWIEGLYARLFWPKLGVRSIDMPNGNMRMVKVGAKSSASYVGESQPAVQTNAKLELKTWSSKKLAAILAYSKDIFLASSPGVDLIMQDDLYKVMMLKKEYTSLYGTGVSGIPAGIANIITSTQKVGSSSTALTRDIPFEMLGRITSTDVNPSFGWLMHPRIFFYFMNLKTTTGAFIYRDEMSKGTLCGYPIAFTTQSSFTDTGTFSTSYGDVWLANWNELIVGTFRNMEVQVSTEGTFIDGDGNMISCFANDLISVRFIDSHDFNTRHNEAFLQGTYKTNET